MKSKAVILFLSILILSMQANADYAVYNNTKTDISFVINQACSQEFGTIQPRDHRILSHHQFFMACEKTPHDCIAQIVRGANCDGKFAATVMFDTDFGLKRILNSGVYVFTWDLDNLYIKDK